MERQIQIAMKMEDKETKINTKKYKEYIKKKKKDKGQSLTWEIEETEHEISVKTTHKFHRKEV